MRELTIFTSLFSQIISCIDIISFTEEPMGYVVNNESGDDSQLYGLRQLSAGRNVIKVTSLSVRNIDILYTKVTLNPIHCASVSLGNLIHLYIYNP